MPTRGGRGGRAGARAEVAAALSGRVLIVGLGPASDFAPPAGVAEVVGIEPSASMRREAEAAVAQARESGLTVEVIDAVAEDLPLPDASCDSALLGYVMCSVDDPPGGCGAAARGAARRHSGRHRARRGETGLLALPMPAGHFAAVGPIRGRLPSGPRYPCGPRPPPARRLGTARRKARAGSAGVPPALVGTAVAP